MRRSDQIWRFAVARRRSRGSDLRGPAGGLKSIRLSATTNQRTNTWLAPSNGFQASASCSTWASARRSRTTTMPTSLTDDQLQWSWPRSKRRVVVGALREGEEIAEALGRGHELSHT